MRMAHQRNGCSEAQTLRQLESEGHFGHTGPAAILQGSEEFKGTGRHGAANLNNEASAEVVGTDDIHRHVGVVRIGQALQRLHKLPRRSQAHYLVHLPLQPHRSE